MNAMNRPASMRRNRRDPSTSSSPLTTGAGRPGCTGFPLTALPLCDFWSTRLNSVLASAAPSAATKSLFGYMKNTVTIKRDIVVPTDDSWSAVSGVEDRLYARAGKKPRTRRAGLKK